MASRYVVGGLLAFATIIGYVIGVNVTEGIRPDVKVIGALLFASFSIPVSVEVIRAAASLPEKSTAKLADYRNEIVVGSALLFVADLGIYYNTAAVFFGWVKF